MYPVSESFLTAVESNSRRYYWSGTITTKNGLSYSFGNEDIVKGSGYISRQCCGSTEIELGGVYAAEFGITLFSDIDRYSLEGALIQVSFHLILSDGLEETIPMGVFEVTEANRNLKTLDIKAYDFMLRFDEPFSGTFTNGTPFDFLSLACETCNVGLGLTKAEIESLPNGTETFGIYADNDISTWRDVLYYLSQALGCFCTIARDGTLVLKRYTANAILNVDSRHRFSSSFSDFITRYSALSITNLRSMESEYYSLEPDDALTMNLGVNPMLQFGIEPTRKRIAENILNAIAQINYVPFDSTTIGNPALDLGDVITFSGGHADHTQISVISSIHCQLNGKQSLKCVGKNPKLAQAKSKNDKNISGLLGSVESSKMAMYNYINARQYKLDSSLTEIINLEFTSTEKTNALFFAEILMDVSVEPTQNTVQTTGSIFIDDTAHSVSLLVPLEERGTCQIETVYFLNGNELTSYVPIQTYGSGKYTLNLYYPITNIEAKTYNTFQVYLRLNGNGSAQIDTAQIRATIIGQGMASGEVEWNGRIEINETIRPVPIFGVQPLRLHEALDYRLIPPSKHSLLQGIPPISTDVLRSVSMVDTPPKIDLYENNKELSETISKYNLSTIHLKTMFDTLTVQGGDANETEG